MKRVIELLRQRGGLCQKAILVAIFWCLVLAAFVLLVSACDLRSLPTVAPASLEAPTSAQALLTSIPTTSPLPTATATVTHTGIISLVIWYPEQLAPSSDQPGGRVLQEQYQAFQEMNPRFKIQGLRKKAHGLGGLLEYLATTYKVLPDHLPDLVALDMDEIARAAELGVLQPMDAFLPDELLNDLFPFTKQASLYKGQRMAVPYEVDVRFLAYNSTMVDPPPMTWSHVLTSGATYLLPLGEGDSSVSDTLLLQYYALGGSLEDQDGQLVLDEPKLAAVLDYYKGGLEKGVIHTAALTTTTLSECWDLYIAGKAAMTEVNARRYRLERSRLKETQHAPIPTSNGHIASIAQGWAWCLVSSDYQRQQAAMALLLWLMEKDNLAARCNASYYLPTRHSSLGGSVGDAEYAAFLQSLLERTYLRPSSASYPAVARLIRAALQEVLAENATAEQAAHELANYIAHLRAK